MLLNDKENLLFVTPREDVVFERGRGLYLYDLAKNKYLDMLGGWATNSLGHCPPVLQKSLSAQAQQLINCSPAFYNTEMLNLAKLIVKVSKLDKVFFCSSGLEANESALKICRKHASMYKNHAHEIICLKNSFHGRSLATMSLSGKEGWKKLFNPKLKGVKHCRVNDFFDFKRKITNKTSAVFLELIQGEGGVIELELDYVQKIRDLTKEKNIVLVLDEIQTGIGRTGKLFAFEHYKIIPDIVTLAKGLGGGYPIGAVLAKKEFDLFAGGENGGTFSSQPLAMRVGRVVLEEIIGKNLVQNARKMGELIKREIKDLAKKQEKIKINNVRGRGLLIGFDVENVDAFKLTKRCFKNKLILNALTNKSIRLIPPLIITPQHIEEFMIIFKKSYLELIKELAS